MIARKDRWVSQADMTPRTRVRFAFTALCSVLAVLSACARGAGTVAPVAPPERAPDASAPAPNPSARSSVPGDMLGCRTPEQSGCEQCCAGDHGQCRLFVSDPHLDEDGHAGYQRSNAPCPEHCPPCARCSQRDEYELRERRASHPECDCSLSRGEDPCWYNSCECFCEQLEPLVSSCPSLAGPT